MNANVLAAARAQAGRLYNPKLNPPKQVWLETFLGKEKQLLDIVELHPRIFGAFPRIDHISKVVTWQKKYRDISYVCMPTRHELPGGTKRLWPQKGSGRARHATENSPIFLKGGWAKGPRGPVTSFELLPHFNLVGSLIAMLTIKLAQNDLRIVDTLADYDSNDPEVLKSELKKRNWGPSTLIIDNKGPIFPEPLAQATKCVEYVNLMSHVGLNTLSMCKHETLVMTLDALKEVEDRLIYQLVRVDLCNTHKNYRSDD